MNALADYMSTESSAAQPHLHPISARDYHRMGEAGILDRAQRTELIEGRIIEMTPIGSRHADRVNRIARHFAKILPDEVVISIQNPVRLDDHSEPEPDIALLRPREKPYSEAHPGPQDVLLIIEVADSSLAYDRDVKTALYARHGIPEYWLLDLAQNRLDIFRQPNEGEYRLRLRPRRGETIVLSALSQMGLELDRILA